MKVLLAGATGAIGRPLLPLLTGAGHDVIALTRSVEKAAALSESSSVTGVACDVFDATAVDAVFADHQPDAVADMLTNLPPRIDPRKIKQAYAQNDRVRREGSGNVIAAAQRHGVGRYVLESVAFMYEPAGSAVKSETDLPWHDAPPPLADSVAAVSTNEEKIAAADFDGVALRFGFFYGPGTFYASDGSTTRDIRRRRYPVIGAGTGRVPLVHVYDAARAVVAALQHAEPGAYNIAHEECPRFGELIDFIAELLDAPRARRLPSVVARVAVGKALVKVALEGRAVSTFKARETLGFEPSIASWRDGLRDYADSCPG